MLAFSFNYIAHNIYIYSSEHSLIYIYIYIYTSECSEEVPPRKILNAILSFLPY